jgi:hypothetical protein
LVSRCARNNLAAFFDVFASGNNQQKIVESIEYRKDKKWMPEEACSWNNTKTNPDVRLRVLFNFLSLCNN